MEMETEEVWLELKKNFLATDAYGNYHVNHPAAAIVHFGHWFGMSRPSPAWVEGLVALIGQETPALRAELRQRLRHFLPDFLAQDFYYDSPETNLRPPDEVSADVFAGYWTLLSYTNEYENLVPSEPYWRDLLTRQIRRSRPYRLNLRYQKLEEADFSLLHTEQADFSFADLSRAVFIKSVIKNSNFHNAELNEANLYGAVWENAYLSFVNFQKAKLSDCQLKGSIMRGANLKQAEAVRADFRRCQADFANFVEADLSLSRFEESNLSQSDFGQANLTRADLREARLDGASFKDANLYQANLRGVMAEETRWEAKNFQKADFRNTKLSKKIKQTLQNAGAQVE
ncbi:MAG: hypothetical protein OHK0053_37870 [Microscillaceae bacterium]